MAKVGDDPNIMTLFRSVLLHCILIDKVQILHYRVILIVALVVIPHYVHFVVAELVAQDSAQHFHV
jgi:hypothetical protein